MANSVEGENKRRSNSCAEPCPKILQQSWKYPYKQVSLLLHDNNEMIQQIMDQTQCKIMFNHSNSNDAHSKMAKITLEGTSNQIFNCHKEINYVRQHGRLMTDKERNASRFANSFRNKNKNGPKKLINWDLDVTDERMLETVNCILSESH
eukprot:190915_1